MIALDKLEKILSDVKAIDRIVRGTKYGLE